MNISKMRYETNDIDLLRLYETTPTTLSPVDKSLVKAELKDRKIYYLVTKGY